MSAQERQRLVAGSPDPLPKHPGTVMAPFYPDRPLRATVPEGIVAWLAIQRGDKLQWKMDSKDGEPVVIITKVKNLEDEALRIAKKYVKPSSAR